MRILMLSHGYPPTVSGVTLVVQKLARAMVLRGHTAMVITASDRGKPYESEDQGVRLVRVRSIRNPFWSEGPLPTSNMHTLRKLIEGFQPDLIHSHENAVLSRQLLRLGFKSRLPLLSSCYFLPAYVTYYLRLGKRINNGIQSLLWTSAVKNLDQYDQVIFSTRSQQQEFVKHGLRAPAVAISNGVDNTRYYPANGLEKEVESHYNLPPRPRVLFVSRLMKDKKVDILLQAMSVILAHQEVHLLLVGRGDDRPRLELMTAELGLQPYVHFLGFVPEEDLPTVYRAADLFAIASVVEVQSIPAIQAAMTGLPIIAANAAALPELVQAGRNGYLVSPDDPQALGEAILQITGDRTRAQQFGQASISIGQAHAETETFRKFDELYRQFVS